MVKRTPRRRPRKGRRHGFFRHTRLVWLALALTGGLVALLITLAVREERPATRNLPPRTAHPPLVQPDLETVVQNEVEAFLASLDLLSPAVRRDLSALPFRYRVEGNMPSRSVREGFAQRLEKQNPNLQVEEDLEHRTLSVSHSGKGLAEVTFHPPPARPVLPIPAGPLVTIIMDDVGRTFYPVEVLLSLAQPVTISILPGEPHAGRIAAMVHQAGREVMLHVPMEPQGYPAVNPGDDALMTRHTPPELKSRLRAFLDRIPQASGVNNHMGSRFTEDAVGLRAVMEVVGERRMFFVDSLTTGGSQVAQVAGEFDVPYLERNVFLDNVADVDAISVQIQKLADLARRRGFAVGICHPYPETLEALSRELPRLAEAGVEVVPVQVMLARAGY